MMAELSSKERVLQLWPDAHESGHHHGGWAIYASNSPLSRCLSGNFVIVPEAWDDAASNLPPQEARVDGIVDRPKAALAVIAAIHEAVKRGKLDVSCGDPQTMALWLGAMQMLAEFMNESSEPLQIPPASDTGAAPSAEIDTEGGHKCACRHAPEYSNFTLHRPEMCADPDRGQLLLASSMPEREDVELAYATRIAVQMREKFWPDVPQWIPLLDLCGVLTQIDNMTCGLMRTPCRAPTPESVAPKVAEPEPEERKWTPEEIQTATYRVCGGGEAAGISFFERHPKLGFAGCVQIQCELDAALRESRELQERLKYAMHFFDSPASFSNEEFAGVAEKVYGNGKEYRGKCPHLDERCAAETESREKDKEIERINQEMQAHLEAHSRVCDWGQEHYDRAEQAESSLATALQRVQDVAAFLVGEGDVAEIAAARLRAILAGRTEGEADDTEVEHLRSQITRADEALSTPSSGSIAATTNQLTRNIMAARGILREK